MTSLVTHNQSSRHYFILIHIIYIALVYLLHRDSEALDPDAIWIDGWIRPWAPQYFYFFFLQDSASPAAPRGPRVSGARRQYVPGRVTRREGSNWAGRLAVACPVSACPGWSGDARAPVAGRPWVSQPSHQSHNARTLARTGPGAPGV